MQTEFCYKLSKHFHFYNFELHTSVILKTKSSTAVRSNGKTYPTIPIKVFLSNLNLSPKATWTSFCSTSHRHLTRTVGHVLFKLIQTLTYYNLADRQVSFTNSFYDHVYLHFLTNKGVQIFSPATLLWSFDHLMWTCIGSSTLGAFLVFRLIMNGMNILEMNTNGRMSFARRGQVSQENWGLRHQIWFVITTYLDQDCVLPTCTPLRCFVALWLFFALIVTTVYRLMLIFSKFPEF